jgi:hypothetical protein
MSQIVEAHGILTKHFALSCEWQSGQMLTQCVDYAKGGIDVRIIRGPDEIILTEMFNDFRR